MVVFLGIILVITPPKVSIPKDKGVTSNNNKSLTSPFNTPPWIAAPTATASSGLTDLLGYFLKKSVTKACTLGILDIPPTSKTSSISSFLRPESLRQLSQGFKVLFMKSSVMDSNLALVNLKVKCLGPEASAVK